jgi:hypothetical protein
MVEMGKYRTTKEVKQVCFLTLLHFSLRFSIKSFGKNV